MRKNLLKSLAISFFIGAIIPNFASADRYEPKPYVQLKNADWTKDAVLYQLNTRQFTKEGTFQAAQKQLPRLKAMGVDIIWLMPIHPIGVKNRKGSLGSPYSVRDYFGVNPEFGIKDDLRNFVTEAHKLGLHVILDLVANHTAWDNDMTKAHPDWYIKDRKGNFRPTPWLDWSDIIDLDYSKPALRKYMTDAMKYWVRDFGIDGYRADVAGDVPLDFWENARIELEKIRPVFMLAEWEQRDMHRRAFDATYAWALHHRTVDVAHGNGDAASFWGYFSENEKSWPKGGMRMNYLENHDSNSWEGTIAENYGDAAKAMLAFSFVNEGIPLIYNGMEACNQKRLEFFEKDPIEWKNCGNEEYITNLIKFKSENSALYNGKWGATMVKVENDNPAQVLSFIRQNKADKVLAVFNFSAREAKFHFADDFPIGKYKDFNGKIVSIDNSARTLPAWGFALYSAR